MKLTDIKTGADLRTFAESLYKTTVTALNGVIEKVPEAMRAGLTKMRDEMNEALGKLPPLDQIPAAMDANYAFMSLTSVLSRMQAYSDQLFAELGTMQKALSEKVTALNALTEQIAKGELLGKDKVKEACELARADERKLLLPEIVSTRKGSLELAGLPCPSDEVLGLPATDYNTRLTAARANVTALGEKGMKLGGKGDAWVKQTAWLSATEFAGQMTAIADVLGTTPPKADPLLGNKGAADTGKKDLSALV